MSESHTSQLAGTIKPVAETETGREDRFIATTNSGTHSRLKKLRE